MISKVINILKKENISAGYSFSSVQANFPKRISDAIITWGIKNIPGNEIYKDDDIKGREDDIHTTVLFGLHTTDPKDVKNIVGDKKPLKIKMGKMSVFNNNKYDVLKIDIEGKRLRWMHEVLKRKLSNSQDFPTYIPHCTIAYMKKGFAYKYIGNSTFDKISFLCEDLIFSSKDGVKTKIKLEGI